MNPIECPACDGEGVEPGTDFACCECDGDGCVCDACGWPALGCDCEEAYQ